MGAHETLRVLQELLVFQHTIFDLSFVYIGMLLAGVPEARVFLLITIAFFSARFSAMLMNRYVGREYDLLNKGKRHMQSLSLSKGLILIAFLASALVFIFSAYLLNSLAFMLSPLVLLLFVIDPVSKRKTKQRHFLIGLMMGLGVFGGYIGNAGLFPTTVQPYLLLFSILFVGAGFDMAYSIAYMAFDKAHGLRTYPAFYGADRSLRYSLYAHSFASLLIILFGISTHSYAVAIASLIAALLLLLEHHGVDSRNPGRIAGRFILYNASTAILLLASVIAAVFAGL